MASTAPKPPKDQKPVEPATVPRPMPATGGSYVRSPDGLVPAPAEPTVTTTPLE